MAQPPTQGQVGSQDVETEWALIRASQGLSHSALPPALANSQCLVNTQDGDPPPPRVAAPPSAPLCDAAAGAAGV